MLTYFWCILKKASQKIQLKLLPPIHFVVPNRHCLLKTKIQKAVKQILKKYKREEMRKYTQQSLDKILLKQERCSHQG